MKKEIQIFILSYASLTLCSSSAKLSNFESSNVYFTGFVIQKEIGKHLGPERGKNVRK